MLFFRSEERVDDWCRAQGLPRRPLLSLDQLWQLAVVWYENRLSPGGQDRAPAPPASHTEDGQTGPASD